MATSTCSQARPLEPLVLSATDSPPYVCNALHTSDCKLSYNPTSPHNPLALHFMCQNSSVGRAWLSYARPYGALPSASKSNTSQAKVEGYGCRVSCRLPPCDPLFRHFSFLLGGVAYTAAASEPSRNFPKQQQNERRYERMRGERERKFETAQTPLTLPCLDDAGLPPKQMAGSQRLRRDGQAHCSNYVV